MKRTLLPMLIATALAIPASAALVAHYTFDDSTNLGANSGTAAIAWGQFSGVSQTTGLIGGAGSFTAGASEAWTGAFGSAGADLSNFSLSMHVKSTGADWKDFVSIGTGNQVVFVLETTTDYGNPPAHGLALYNIGQVGGTAANEGNVVSAADARGGNWHHLGFSVSGGQTTLYVDGVNQGSADYSGSGLITAFQLASRFGTGARAITAEIDDMGVWDNPLTDEGAAILNGLGRIGGNDLSWLDEAQALWAGSDGDTATINGVQWQKVAGLTGVLGDWGGAGANAVGSYIVLDGSGGGIQIIPEPTAALLAGVGLLGLLRRRRA